RVEVKKARNEIEVLDKELEKQIQSYDKMMGMWVEFDPTLLRVKDVQLSKKKIAGVVIPMLDRVDFELKPFSVFNQPKWYLDGVKTLETLAEAGIRRDFHALKVERLDYARKKTTQKVNLFEKVQIPGYKDAILKIKRYLEDEENLSKASQKIMRARLEKKREKEEEESVC
ncbi:MAG TPA: V-type ATP synthase subunit D, partial [Salinivirgaceae bacterium]|nr:V-type ATP synthase subunit D [Salinivirgaceae bacterium]